MLFGFILLLQGEICFVNFLFQHFVFVIEGLTDFVEFIKFVSILLPFPLIREALFSEFSDLDLIIL